MVKKDIVLETLQGLVKDGQIKPEDVISEAQAEDSPIHNSFEWDDTKAAQEHRLWQARQLITYKFEIEERQTQAYYNLNVTIDNVKMQGYFSKEKVLSDKDMYLTVLKDAIKEIKYWQKKYREIKELEGVINEEKLDSIV